MTEKLLQFIWQFQYFNAGELQTEQGEAVSIIAPGIYNTNQGPDFLQAKIKIGKTIWAGNVELHVNTSDWNKHAHNTDSNYKNVILHVVWNNDLLLEKSSLPILVLQNRVSNLLLYKYEQLMTQQNSIACADSLQSVKEIIWITWKNRLFVERMQRKSAVIIEELLPESNNHWEEICWWLMARSFGVKVNADAFEILAKSISINILAKQKNSIHQLEALLFGQAGLLDAEFEDDYPKMLQREYAFLSRKHNLQKPKVQIRFLRMRPSSFPTVRLAQLAAFVHNSLHLFSKIQEAKTIKNVTELLDVTANDYWHYHYRFDEQSEYLPKRMGRESINRIIINTIAPLLFAYDDYHKREVHKEKILEWLQQLPPENNAITKVLAKCGVKNENAFASQALIELKSQYCDEKKCLNCAIGNNLLKLSES